jgi:hypothetical protein
MCLFSYLIHVLQGHDPAVPAEPADLPCRGVGGLPPLLRPIRVLPARSQVSLSQKLTLLQDANSCLPLSIIKFLPKCKIYR